MVLTLNMGRTRDIIEEIADVRNRRMFGEAMAELPLRLFALERAFNEHDNSQKELTRYFPVALIACVEGYFRMAVKDLIDAGEPFLSNAEKPASSIKLDFSVVRAVHGKVITVGELVAHSVKLSSLEHIDAIFSNLLGVNFLNALRTTKSRWAIEVKKEPAVSMLAEPDQVFADVARTFELRHIICHEIASEYEIDTDEIARCFESCVSFLRVADEHISDVIHPGAPLTQSEMNVAAGKALGNKKNRLDELVAEFKSHLKQDALCKFDKIQCDWQLYCDGWANFVADEQALGGSIWPVIFSGTAESTIDYRLDELEHYSKLSDNG